MEKLEVKDIFQLPKYSKSKVPVTQILDCLVNTSLCYHVRHINQNILANALCKSNIMLWLYFANLDKLFSANVGAT